VTAPYLRRLAQRHESTAVTIDAATTEGRRPPLASLGARRGAGGRWLVRRDELAAHLDRRRPQAVRVGYDLTLTTVKSLGVLALLSGDPTRRAVLDAIRVGNDRALDWLEHHAAITRVNGKPVPTTGWAIASFQHMTSRAWAQFGTTSGATPPHRLDGVAGARHHQTIARDEKTPCQRHKTCSYLGLDGEHPQRGSTRVSTLRERRCCFAEASLLHLAWLSRRERLVQRCCLHGDGPLLWDVLWDDAGAPATA
jgi:hypothetical protein